MKIKRYNELNENHNDNVIVQHFENGEINSFKDFYDNLSTDYSDHYSTCNLSWTFDIDANRDGVNGIDTTIVSVELITIIETYDEGTDETNEEEVILNFNSDNSEIVIHDKEWVGDHEKQVLPYYPQDIDFERDKNTGNVKITVNFV